MARNTCPRHVPHPKGRGHVSNTEVYKKGSSPGKVRATRKVREGEGVGALCPVLCVRAWTPAERLL